MPTHFAYYIARFICFAVLKIYCRVRVYGRENIPKQGSFIISSNHESHLDPPAVSISVPQIVHFMARDDLFDVRFLGSLLKKIAVYPVKRRQQDLKAVKDSLRKLKEGKVIGIFPEGGRVEEPGLGEPALGIGMLAAHSGVPVLPVFIKGTGEALPKHAKSIKFWPVKVYIGKPLKFEKYKEASKKKEAYKEFSSRVMESISYLKELHAAEN